MKLYPGTMLEKSFLEAIFLGLPFFAFFFFHCLPDLLHEITLTVTMQPWPALIDTKGFSYVFLISLKTYIDKEARKVAADQRNEQAYGG